jgi:hypothetical protein
MGLQSRFSGRRACSQGGPSALPPERGGLAAFLLGCLVAPVFCGGLFGLAVLPTQGVAVPRWLILAYGFGCVLLALAAAALGRRGSALRPSGQQDRCPLGGEGTPSPPALGIVPMTRSLCLRDRPAADGPGAARPQPTCSDCHAGAAP